MSRTQALSEQRAVEKSSSPVPGPGDRSLGFEHPFAGEFRNHKCIRVLIHIFFGSEKGGYPQVMEIKLDKTEDFLVSLFSDKGHWGPNLMEETHGNKAEHHLSLLQKGRVIAVSFVLHCHL